MSTPLVSIVIDNFNYERYLRLSIDSALDQASSDVEVVVVDDASTDGSPDLVRSYGDRVVPVLRDRNGGQAAALNSGFAASRGEIVIFLDSDDELYPHAVSRVLSAWNPGLSKVHYRLDLVDGEGKTLDLIPRREISLDSGDVLPRLLAVGRYQTTVMSGNAFSRAALERIMPIPEDDFRISADGYLVTLAPFHGRVAVIDEPLGAYRLHGRNGWAIGASPLDAGSLAERLRQSLDHDAARHRVLDAAARRHGVVGPVPMNGLSDVDHLFARAGSLCLDPSRHPYPDDSLRSLSLRGFRSVRETPRPWRRQTLLSAWFLAVGWLPRPLASRAAAWYLAPGSRPPAMRRALTAVRRWTRNGLRRPADAARGGPPARRRARVRLSTPLRRL